jgi:hypothetical protein
MDILEPILRCAGTKTTHQQIRDMPSATAPAFGLKVISGERGKIGKCPRSWLSGTSNQQVAVCWLWAGVAGDVWVLETGHFI